MSKNKILHSMQFLRVFTLGSIWNIQSLKKTIKCIIYSLLYDYTIYTMFIILCFFHIFTTFCLIIHSHRISIFLYGYVWEVAFSSEYLQELPNLCHHPYEYRKLQVAQVLVSNK